MAELSLEVTKRENTGKGVARRLRADGKVPAVVYGGHREATPISVDRKTVSELIQKSQHGIRSIFLLKMTDTDQQRHAMIKDFQIDPISRKMTHIDFVRVSMDEKIKVTIPVHTVGSAIGVKEGGLMDFQVRDLHIECLPNAIPDTIDVDITNLNIHDYLRIADLKLPEGVKVLDDPERVVVGVTHVRAEAEPTPEAAAAGAAEAAEPEVIRKGKAETEEEGAAAPAPAKK